MAMQCRACNSTNTRVTVTERHGYETWRYNRCEDCGAKYKTIEVYERRKPGPPKGTPRPGNRATGAKHPHSIFTPEDIINMRKLHKQGATLKVIATKYGINPSYVSRIVNRKQWKTVP